MSLVRNLVEARAVTSWGPYDDPRRIPSNGETGTVHSGQPVNDRTALNLVAFYACVRLLADTVASLPWHEYRKVAGAREELPQPALLRDPYVEVTDFDWKHMMMVSLAMRGNFYGLVLERDALEFPTQIMPLHPDIVDRQAERVGGRVTGRIVTRIDGDVIPPADLFHVRGFTPPGASDGLSPVNMARHAIGLGLAAQQFGGQWFGDGAAPSSLLSSKQPLDEGQAKRAQIQWIKSHGGRRYPAVLTGDWTYQAITITPEESQFLGTRNFSIKEMAMLFGVPPHMIGDTERSTSWGTGIEHMSIGFATYTLRSWLTRIEAAVTRLRPRGRFVRFGLAALLRGDTKSRYESYRLAREASWLNVDEIRALEDRPPLPDGAGQDYIQPLNFAPLGTDPRQQQGGTNDDD